MIDKQKTEHWYMIEPLYIPGCDGSSLSKSSS